MVFFLFFKMVGARINCYLYYNQLIGESGAPGGVLLLYDNNNKRAKE